MSPKLKHNLLVAPIVIFVRAPIMIFLNVFVWLGEASEKFADERLGWLPWFER